MGFSAEQENRLSFFRPQKKARRLVRTISSASARAFRSRGQRCNLSRIRPSTGCAEFFAEGGRATVMPSAGANPRETGFFWSPRPPFRLHELSRARSGRCALQVTQGGPYADIRMFAELDRSGNSRRQGRAQARQGGPGVGQESRG